MKPKLSRTELFVSVVGGLMCIMGCVVIAGWYLRSPGLIVLYLGTVPTKFNNAICHVVGGLALVGIGLRRRAVVAPAGIVSFAVGSLTLLQYLFHANFGIDQLLLHDWTGLPQEAPGRMAPNTAAMLSLWGFNLILMSDRRRWPLAHQVLAASMLAISIAAIGGHLTGWHAAYTWGKFAGMSVRTSVTFGLAAVAQMAWGAERARQRGQRVTRSLPFFATGLASIAVLAAAIYATTLSQKAAFASLERSEEVLKELQSVARDIAVAESALRGFILTQDPSFRQDVSRLENSLRENVADLTRLTSDNVAEQTRTLALERAMQARLAFMQEGAAHPSQSAAEIVQRTTAGRVLTQNVQALVDEMVHQEEALRADRRHQNDVSMSQLRSTSLFGCGLIIPLFLVAIALTLRAEAKQNEAEEKILQSNRSLEEQVQERTAELRSAVEAADKISQRLKTVLAHTPIVLWAIDRNGLFTMIEGRGLDVLNMDPEKLIGTSHLDLVKTISPKTYASTLRALAGEAFTVENRHASGTWYRTTYSPVKNDRGEVTELIAVSLEVTDVKRAEQLKIDEQSARESSRLKSEFLANMSHEIRTPMNGVIGMTTLLLDTPLSPEQREMANVVQNSSESLLSIINDILDFSKIEAGKLRIEANEFDLRVLVDETLSLLAPRAHEKGLQLLCDFDLALPTGMRGDGGRIRQVITNLVGNAIKFTSAGEISVVVRQTVLDLQRVGFRLEVTDTGIGIPEHLQKTLFKPFEQGDSGTTRRFGGTGLGLAISRQLIELMVGTLGFKSSADRGSTFWFELELPRAEVTLSDTIAPFATGGHALIVDNNPASRRILGAQVGKLGFSCETADNAQTARALLARDGASPSFTVALIDWHMPGGDGPQLSREIRQNRNTSSLPIIVLSSSSSDAREARALDAHVLAKPARESQLRRTVSQALSGHRTTHTASNLIPESTQPIRVLLADDNLTNQLVGRLLLEKMGHSVAVVADGYKALEAIRAELFDLVFMDCQMPELDGYEATRRIRSGLAGPDRAKVPIIALTAYAMASDRIQCLEAGMDDYISKPLRVEDVSSAILRFTGGRPDGAAPETWDSTQPPFDPSPLTQFDRMTSEGEPVVNKFIEIFERDEPKRLAAMKIALVERSAKTIAMEAHSMAGTCGTLGGREVRVRAREIEEAANGEDWTSLPSRIAELEQALGRFHNELRRFVSEQ